MPQESYSPENCSFMEKLYRWDCRFNLTDVLLSNNIRSVAIYGAGKLGSFFTKRLLHDGDISVKFVIDKNPDTDFPFNVPVVHPDNIPQTSDLDLVIMAVQGQMYDESLWYDIKQRVKCDVARLYEIVIDVYLYDLMIKTLRYVHNCGCHPLLLCYRPPLWENPNPSSWESAIRVPSNIQWLIKGINSYQPTLGHVYKDIPYCSEHYLNEILSVPAHITQGTSPDEYQILIDRQGIFNNVVNEHRLTVGTPDVYDAKVYFFGCCVTAGWATEDKHTIPSQVQAMLMREQPKGKIFKVENHALCCYFPKVHFLKILNTHLEPGSHVLLLTRLTEGMTVSKYYAYSNPLIRYFDLVSALKRPHKYDEVLISYLHPNHNGAKLLAEKTYSILSEDINRSNVENKLPKESRKYLNTLSERNKPVCALFDKKNIPDALRNYVDVIKALKRPETEKKIGSIVCNCNPFTKGHQYLIQSAAKRCDHLFVFVVQEDKSFFSFHHRFEMVKQGTEDIKNVTVIPSGSFILSNETLPEYFTKDSLATVTIDASNDLKIFCELICPTLNITVRYLGNEPTCQITHQYNQAISKTLPCYGIDVVILDRICSDDGKPISASRVREILQNEDISKLQTLIPTSTYDYLLKTHATKL